MATKVPSSVLHRESPAKGFAIKPRRFSKLYGICKRGIIYFYSTEKNVLWKLICLMKLSPYVSREISLVGSRESIILDCEKINNTY